MDNFLPLIIDLLYYIHNMHFTIYCIHRSIKVFHPSSQGNLLERRNLESKPVAKLSYISQIVIRIPTRSYFFFCSKTFNLKIGKNIHLQDSIGKDISFISSLFAFQSSKFASRSIPHRLVKEIHTLLQITGGLYTAFNPCNRASLQEKV